MGAQNLRSLGCEGPDGPANVATGATGKPACQRTVPRLFSRSNKFAKDSGRRVLPDRTLLRWRMNAATEQEWKSSNTCEQKSD